MFVAAQAGLGLVDFGKRGNPLLEQVEAISILGEARELTPEERELEELRGPKVADRAEDDPRLNGELARQEQAKRVYVTDDGTQIPAWLIEGDDVADKNSAGSYEALMGGWADGWGKKSFNTEAAEQ